MAWFPAVKLPTRGPDADQKDESSYVTPVMRGWICDGDSVWWGEGRISSGAAPTPKDQAGTLCHGPQPLGALRSSRTLAQADCGRACLSPPPGLRCLALQSVGSPTSPESGPPGCRPERGPLRRPGLISLAGEKQLVAMATSRPASLTTRPAAQARVWGPTSEGPGGVGRTPS